MDYVAPNTITKTLTVDDVTHSVTYYEPPALLRNVTDESYAEYNNTVTYAMGDFVKLDAMKKYFRCTTSGTVGKHPLSYPDLWIDYGPINSYRMLATDSFINHATTGTDVIIDIDFSRCDTVAFVSSDFTSVRIELFDNLDGLRVFDEEYIGRDYGALSYAEYYFTDYKTLSRLVVSGFDYMPNATLRLTFSGPTSIGGLVYGNKRNLGATLYGTKLRFEDTSKINLSQITGTRTVTRYGSVRIAECKVALDAADFNVIANQVEAIIGRNVLFLPTTLDEFSELISIGYIENMDIPIDNPTKMLTQTTIIGVL